MTVTKASLNYSRDHTVAEGLGHIALQNSSSLMSEDLVKSFMMSGGAAAIQFAPTFSSLMEIFGLRQQQRDKVTSFMCI